MLSGKVTVKIVLSLSVKGLVVKNKFAPKLVPYTVDPFLERDWCAEKQTASHKVVNIILEVAIDSRLSPVKVRWRQRSPIILS